MGGGLLPRRGARCVGVVAVALAVVGVGAGAAGPQSSPESRPPAGAGVSVIDTSGPGARPCGDVRPGGAAGSVAGGCTARARGDGIALTVNTFAGRMAFARCEVTYTLHVDRRGRTALAALRFFGDPVCADARICFEGNRSSSPRGRIVRGEDGRLLHVVDLCLDTCIGRFAGRMQTALTRDASGWREEADHALVGASGWELDGSWRLARADFRILPRRG